MGRIAVAAILCMWVLPVSVMVNRIVTDPYMDEVFHIPQAQQYCRGNFKSWDPMITTPPGLYYLSFAHIASLFPGMWYSKTASSFHELCSTAVLRSVNGVLAVICSIVVYDLLIHLRPDLGERRATVYSVILALYPVHWFFTFLYYTDVASLTGVLAMYLACLKGKYWFSALLGGLAILIRQTNVVWMLFVACIGAINYRVALNGKDHVQINDPNISIGNYDSLADKKSITVAPNLRKRKMGSHVVTDNLSISGKSAYSSSHDPGLLDEIKTIFLKLWHLKWKILISFSPYILILIAFVALDVWNGSLALGAKEAHAVSPHLTQIIYFGLVSAAAMAPVHFSIGQAAVL